MSYLTGLLLIDAPASALNNLGNIETERNANVSGVKVIYANDGTYPYVSAQAFRYWLRQTITKNAQHLQASPIYREEKIAYTDSNPMKYWDDDLFGYMRAPSKKESAKARRDADATMAQATPLEDTVTRVAPFRVGTLVSIAPIRPTSDFGTMSRQEGNPVPHEHQFYRTTLKGLFSLGLSACGTFSYQQRTGFRNLDDVRINEAKVMGLEESIKDKSYRLPLTQRIERVAALLEGMAHLEGGAKQTLHYTDVAPVVVVLAVTKGGNHIFGHVVGADSGGQPELKIEALQESLRVFSDDILSSVYIGWTRGYADKERNKVEALAVENPRIKLSHPREAFQALVADLKQHTEWLN